MSAHALVALAWRLEKVSRKFATPSNSVFRDVSGHSVVPGCSVVFLGSVVFRCWGVLLFLVLVHADKNTLFVRKQFLTSKHSMRLLVRGLVTSYQVTKLWMFSQNRSILHVKI